ncbi:acyl carrier protein [Streptomyces sp. NPDC092952]|uniref:acyl carrier protein n=1 Tax=Streptomyces sp. NPDC092952 TaxID=3366018 RepID=UPI0037F8EE9B
MEEQFLIDFGDDVTPQSDLFKEGIIDSFGYVQLMSFLKKEFSLEIESAEFLLEVPASLEAIDRFVADRMDRSGTPGGAPCAE